ncbi:MAG: hypothetical protein WC919_05435 [Candidatus Paceibacterota bacterium]|jgi:predicted RNA-binding Zn-ribbon protein involved in translation (DUF1610 family)
MANKPRKQPTKQRIYPKGDFHRCPTCGGMVQMPCIACRELAGVIPENYEELQEKPRMRRCRECGKIKPAPLFDGLVCSTPGFYEVHTVCRRCRGEEDKRTNDECNNIRKV